MMWIEEKYLKQISYRLDGYVQKQTSPFLANTRCPICGDSKLKKNKKRCFFYEFEGTLMVKCWNCGYSQSFKTFLEGFDFNLFQEYNKEMFVEKFGTKKRPEFIYKVPETKKYIPNIFESLPNVKDLEDDHPAKIWCLNRVLPIDSFDFYLAEKFIEWSTGNTDKFKTWRGSDHSRIIIPWHDRDKKIIGYSARCWNSDEEQKYFRIFVDTEAKEHFFGLDRLDESKTIYVVEGEIDSLMISNAVAVSNGKLQTYMNPKAVYIPDSDVRNPQIMKNVEKMVNIGLKVCFLPENLPGKDLNEFRQVGLTKDEILHIIEKHTHQGLRAQLEFTKWSKV